MNASNQLPVDTTEWADAKEIKRRFGLGRSALYGLMAAGQIKSSSIRLPGKVKGRRLFSVPSVRALIEKNATAANG